MKIINISLLVISYLSISHGWECRKIAQHDGVKQIDAGGGFVVISDGSGAYLLSDSQWNRLGTVAIKQVSAGIRGIFGVDGAGYVHRYFGQDFKPSEGQSLEQLDVGGNGVILGVYNSAVYCLNSDNIGIFGPFSSLTWETINQDLVSISCNPSGCWGVNSENAIFYTDITPGGCTGTTWDDTISDAAASIEAAADGSVFRVDPDGNLYERTGITSTATSGTDWSQITLDDNVKQVAYDFGSLWVITTDDEIQECSRTGLFCKSPAQHAGAQQIDAGQGVVVMRDFNNQPYILTGDQWDDLGSTSLKHVSVGLAAIWGVDNANKVYKYVGDEFVLLEGQELAQVDAGGNGEVVGVTSNSEFSCLRSSLAAAFDAAETETLGWDDSTTAMTYVSCSPNSCWGVDNQNMVFYTTITPATCVNTGWTQQGNDEAVKVEVDQDGEVYMWNEDGEVFKRVGFTATEPSGTEWEEVEVPLAFVQHASSDLSTLWLLSNGGLMAECLVA